jgi:hypothetical protein
VGDALGFHGFDAGREFLEEEDGADEEADAER